MKKFIPSVTFELAPIELESDLLLEWALGGGQWAEVLDKTYPQLRNVLKDVKKAAEAKPLVRKFVEGVMQNKKAKMSEMK